MNISPFRAEDMLAYGSLMEDFPLNGRRLNRRPLGVIELVETRGKKGLDRRRHLEVLVDAPLEYEREQLLDEERITLSRLNDLAPRTIVE
jgi:hypothetical protein